MDKNWSGERLETFVFRDTAVEHLHRYAFTLEFIENKKVLDIACGEGYGSNIMAKKALKVFGVDIDSPTIEKAKSKYNRNNLTFLSGSTNEIPLGDHSVDVVVSFETIEHHDQHEKMMQEIKRVLTPDGILIISSPEKSEYSDKRNYQNPFHVKELYLSEFKDLMSKYFSFSSFFHQNSIKGSAIIPESSATNFEAFHGNYNDLEKVNILPKYILAIASDIPLNQLWTFSFFNGNDIIKREQELIIEEAINKKLKWVRNSWTYRIGSIFTFPVNFLRKISKD